MGASLPQWIVPYRAVLCGAASQQASHRALPTARIRLATTAHQGKACVVLATIASTAYKSAFKTAGIHGYTNTGSYTRLF